jgi:hypothetical protein
MSVYLKVPKFKNPLLSVEIDETPSKKIAFSPYEVSFEQIKEGKHKINITAYGNRINAFGAVHNNMEGFLWFGPSAWREYGDAWSYEYCLKPMGILQKPQLYMEIKTDPLS